MSEDAGGVGGASGAGNAGGSAGTGASESGMGGGSMGPSESAKSDFGEAMGGFGGLGIGNPGSYGGGQSVGAPGFGGGSSSDASAHQSEGGFGGLGIGNPGSYGGAKSVGAPGFGGGYGEHTSALYSCSRPLEALGGNGQRSGPDIAGNPAYHQSLCAKQNGTMTCGGQTGLDGLYGRGAPSVDTFDPDRCELIGINDCLVDCIIDRFDDPRPDYGLFGPGTNCQEWADQQVEACLDRCF